MIKKLWIDNTEPPKDHIWCKTSETGKQLGIYENKSGKWIKKDIGESSSSSGEDWDKINQLAYGIEWQEIQNTSDCKRIGNMEYHRTLPCHQWKGCVANAEVINYYLDPTDWSKKIDGTPSVLDGTDGTVRTEVNTFYYKSWSFKENANITNRVMVSPTKIDDTWHEFPHLLVDSFYATLDRTDTNNIKAVSVINKTIPFRGYSNKNQVTTYDVNIDTDPRLSDLGKPVTDLSLIEMSNYAKANDSEVFCYDFYKMLIYWMPCIEYATLEFRKDFNPELTAEGYHQGGLSKGCFWFNNSSWWTNTVNGYPRITCRTPNGFTNEFGNGSGVKKLFTTGEIINTDKTVPEDILAVRYRGIENPWGDVKCILEGILAGGCIKKTSDPAKFTNNPADMDEYIDAKAFDQNYPFIYNFDVSDSCEIFGKTLSPTSGDFSKIFALYNQETEDNSTQIRQMIHTYRDDIPYVLISGGFASFGARGGPAFMQYDERALSDPYNNSGFRTVSRIDGSSKNLQIRTIS